ncbi:MAG: polysaccharide deacetylase family protein [Butyricicoccus sp.]
MRKKISGIIVLLCVLVAAIACGILFLPRETKDDTGSGQTDVSTPAGSAQLEEPEVEREENEPKGPAVVIDGEEMSSFSTLRGETVMISAEEFAEKMQAEYTFDETSQAVTLVWNDRTAELTVGQSEAILNGESVSVEAPYRYEDMVMIPAESIAESFAADATMYKGTLYLTPYAGDWEVPAGYSVPTLMYHAVSDDPWGSTELFVSPSELEKQLQYLNENGYTTITFEDLYRIDEIEKPVLLTFDDGYDDNYENLYPLLQEYNCKATVFMITHSYEKDVDPAATHKMTKKQMQEMSESGLVSIQSHTRTHRRLGELSAEEQEQEMKQSQRKLLQCTGKMPFVLCYPEGSYNDSTLDIASQYYHFGIKMTGGLYNTSDNPFLVNRYYISRYTDLSTFASYVSSAG